MKGVVRSAVNNNKKSVPEKKLALGHDNKPRPPASAAKRKRRRGAIINPNLIKGGRGVYYPEVGVIYIYIYIYIILGICVPL